MGIISRTRIRWKQALLFCALWPLVASLAPVPPLATYEFGFSLNPTLNEDLYTLWIYKVYQDRVIDSHPITLGTLMIEARGIQQSRANPAGIDLFAEYGVPITSTPTGKMTQPVDVMCPSLDLLYKLRYGPGAVQTVEPGWAQEAYAPSLRQQYILQVYRSPYDDHWHGPYYGKRAFLLLRDILDPLWVETYRDGG